MHLNYSNLLNKMCMRTFFMKESEEARRKGQSGLSNGGFCASVCIKQFKIDTCIPSWNFIPAAVQTIKMK